MVDPYNSLRRQLAAVEKWLDDDLPSNLTKQERDLANSLRKYILHCQRNEEKWNSESKAEDAIFKINTAWAKLYKAQMRKN